MIDLLRLGRSADDGRSDPAARLLSRCAALTVILYAVTSIHHVIEGAGWVFGFRLKSLLVPVTFALPLLMTLGLLLLYKRSRHRLPLGLFAAAALLWWVVGVGLSDGLYNHTLDLALAIAHAPGGVFRVIYPTYVPHPANGTFTMPCDGQHYSYCTITTASVSYELAGIASFAISWVLAIGVYRLIAAHRRGVMPPAQELPRPVRTWLAAGIIPSFGATPLLSMYMSSGKPASLILGLLLMTVGLAALAIAFRASGTVPQADMARAGVAQDEAPPEFKR